ncbi:MAG: hypothetical protein KAS72_05125 [Phycisphaerales bacterium]|nr:hypothetical protein [Phycisphaerales bacterium]
MNVASFFKHWSITSNPFQAEEARHDAVFAKLGVGPAVHSDFDKICGELDRPSTSIVFGEKGSGKTAIRLQIEDRLRQFNADNPDRKCFFIPYDDLNPMLDRFHRRMGSPAPLDSFKQLRLVDHMDAILHQGVSRLVDGLVGGDREDPIDLGDRPRKAIRKADGDVKRDLLLLQVCYDNPETGHEWTHQLAGVIRRQRLIGPRFHLFFGGLLLVACAALLIYWSILRGKAPDVEGFRIAAWPWLLAGILSGLFGIGAWWRWLRLWRPTRRDARRLSAQLRTLDRTGESFYRSLVSIRHTDRIGANLPFDNSDDVRYDMFKRLRRVLRVFGYGSILIILDRIDEPTLVNGSVQAMRAITWPMLNSKFLQQEGIGVKLLLPLELRHELFRESSDFFQQARLDKQNLVERLTWSGAMLYDLCNARLRVCTSPQPGRDVHDEPPAADATSMFEDGPADSAAALSTSELAGPTDDGQGVVGSSGSDDISLHKLFCEDVSRQDIVDALDQMQQPRDAFKLLYTCIQEHCSTVTEEDAAWTVPRLILESVRRQQSGRVQELHKGLRPA